MGKKDEGIDRDLLAFAGGLDEDSVDTGKKAKSKKQGHSTTKSDRPHLSYTPTLDAETGQVSVGDLTALLGDDTGFANLRRRIGDIDKVGEGSERTALKKKKKGTTVVDIVAAPLDAHKVKRLERAAAYDISTREINRWVPIVRANRNASNLVFPSKPSLAPSNIVQCLQGMTAAAPTSLEKRMREIVERNGWASEQGLIKEEQLELAKLTPEEVEKRYGELAKKRAFLFFSERKNKRQSKIKSKTFRKIVKKERERRVLKEAESSGAQLTEEELREEHVKAELDRIRERMTLKTHKASKWAHDLMQKRRLESGSREEVMQQVRDKDRLRQEILGKASQFGDLKEQEDAAFDDAGDDDHFVDDEEEVDSETEPAHQTRPKRTRSMEDDCSDIDEASSEEDEVNNEVDEMFNEASGRGKRLNDAEGSQAIGRRVFSPENPLNSTDAKSCAKKTASGALKTPKKLEKSKDDLECLFKAEDGGDGIAMDAQTKSQLEMIKKAFDGDAVFANFEAQKQAEVEEDRPKDIDLTLPGWGSWGGEGIALQKGKVILKATGGVDPTQRKDANLRHVIIHEKRSKKLAKLMVQKAPFPYRSREEYEQSLNKPVGKEWNSTTAYCKKIKPRIQARVGHVIEPIKYVKQTPS